MPELLVLAALAVPVDVPVVGVPPPVGGLPLVEVSVVELLVMTTAVGLVELYSALIMHIHLHASCNLTADPLTVTA